MSNNVQQFLVGLSQFTGKWLLDLYEIAELLFVGFAVYLIAFLLLVVFLLESLM